MKLAEIIVALDSGKRKQKRTAMSHLYRLAQKGRGTEAIPSLITLVGSDDSQLRLEALAAVAELDTKAHIDLFVSNLADANSQIRGFCACVLSNEGYKSLGYPVLRALLNSSEEIERQWGDLYSSQVPSDFDANDISPDELHGDDSTVGGNSKKAVKSDVAMNISDHLQVEIHFCDGDSAPSPLQLEALKLIEKLPGNVAVQIQRELERRLKEIDLDYDGEPLETTVLGGLIPALKNSKSTYFLLYGDSGYDVEHGFACLFRDQHNFCICERDVVDTKYATDDVSAFEEAFRTEPVLTLK